MKTKINMTKPPAFQFYVQDFLVGTLSFSAEEIGAYLLLLLNQWDNGVIKEDEVELISRVNKDKLTRVLLKFRKTKKGLVNARMEASKKNSENFKKIKSKSGKKGAENRWCNKLKNKELDGSAIGLPIAKNSSSSSSSSSSSNNSKLSKENAEIRKIIFELLRTKTNRNTIDDRQVYEETAYFLNKYDGQEIGNLAALVSTWAGNIRPVTKDRFTQ